MNLKTYEKEAVKKGIEYMEKHDWCKSDRLHNKESQELNQEDQIEDYEDNKE